MKTNRIYVNTDYRDDKRINYKVNELIFTGEGAGDYVKTTIAQGTTLEKFPITDDEESDDKIVKDFFKTKFAKEGFEFDCLID